MVGEVYYYRARYYSPRLRRFVSEDPILRPFNLQCTVYGNNPAIIWLFDLIKDYKNINAFIYGKNNPLTYFDPYGLKECKERQKCIDNVVKIRKVCTYTAWGSQVICTVMCVATGDMFPVCALYCHRSFSKVRITCWITFVANLHYCYSVTGHFKIIHLGSVQNRPSISDSFTISFICFTSPVL